MATSLHNFTKHGCFGWFIPVDPTWSKGISETLRFTSVS
jgi:hypothetical protein